MALGSRPQQVFDNTYRFGKGVFSKDAIILPSGRSLYGEGSDETLIQVKSGVINDFITTAGYPGVPGGGTNSDKRFAGIRNIQIDGQRNVTEASSELLPFIANCAKLGGQYPHIVQSVIRRFQGTGAIFQAMNFSEDSHYMNLFTGIEVTSSDCCVQGGTIQQCRDDGILINGQVGHTQVSNVHIFGVHTALRMVTGSGASSTQSTGNTYADGHHGFYGTFSNRLTNDWFQHLASTGARFDGPSNFLVNCTINTQAVVGQSENAQCWGVYFTGSGSTYNQIIGGTIALDGYFNASSQTPTGDPSHCVRISGDHNEIIGTLLNDLVAVNGSKAVHVEGNNGGLLIDVPVQGFHGSNSRLLWCNGAIRQIRARYRGPNINLSTPEKYVTIPAGWTGSIELINTSVGGGKLNLVEGTAY